MEELYSHYSAENKEKIRQNILGVMETLITKIDLELNSISLPTSSPTLEGKKAKLLEEARNNFTNSLQQFKDGEIFSKSVQELEVMIYYPLIFRNPLQALLIQSL